MTATLGIRLEDKNRWERRTPLVPDDDAHLVAEGVRVLVQPSHQRVYDDEAYRAAGGELTNDLSAADAVFAVKEVPGELIRPDTTYTFFAHVIKGQAHNMPLLKTLLDRRATLIDYELITGDDGKRLVLFGRQAGQAGMIDSLSLLGDRLATEGVRSPLEEIRPSYTYADMAAAEEHLREAADRWRKEPPKLPDPPLVVAIAGRGNVGRGAEHVLDLLPTEEVTPEELPAIVQRPVNDRIFKVVLRRKHLFRPLEVGKDFDPDEYREYPERYTGRLLDHLPYVSVLMSCIFWAPRYPRLLTRAQTREMWRRGTPRLRLIGDVTCDIDGAFETTYRVTTPDQPAYVYDPENDTFRDDVESPGLLVMAVDNLPCELPKDASDQFSRALLPFAQAIARADYRRPYEALELPPEIHRAVITHRGTLVPHQAHLAQALEKSLSASG